MLQFIANGLCKGAVYALVASGFGLIYTTTGVFHIAHGAIYTLAAYILFLSFAILKLPMALSVAMSLVLAAALGVMIEIVVYRPLAQKKASSTVLMISSLGVYIVLVNFIALFLGNETRIVRSGQSTILNFGSVILTDVQFAEIAIFLSFMGMYWVFLRKSSIGRVCRAVADDTVLASALGVNVRVTRMVVSGVGSALAGIGAVLIAMDVGFDPHVGFPVFLSAAVACIIGGLHQFVAPALGGIVLGLIQSLVVWRASAKWEGAVTFTVLICFLLFRPQGLLGTRQRCDEQ